MFGYEDAHERIFKTKTRPCPVLLLSQNTLIELKAKIFPPIGAYQMSYYYYYIKKQKKNRILLLMKYI